MIKTQTKNKIQAKDYLNFPISALLIKEAINQNIDCQIKKRPLKNKKILYLKLEQKEKTKWICPKRGYFNVKTACDLTLFKYLTNQILKEKQLPVSQMQKITRLSDLKNLSISPPWVIKPVAEKGGSDILLSIKKIEQLKRKAKTLLQKYPSLIIEKQIQGKDYRLLIIKDRFIAATQKKLPQITGDGKKTIRKLIDWENKNRKSRADSFAPYLKPIPIDQHLKNTLAKQNYQLGSILEKNKPIRLRENGNFSTGAAIKDITEQVHSINKKIAVQAIQALDLEIGGVDIIAKDISQPIDQTKGKIIEINAGPGIWTHHFPHQGQSRNIAKIILDYLFLPE